MLIALQDILDSAERYGLFRELLRMMMIFMLACLVVLAIVIIWRAGDIGQILEAVLPASRRDGGR